MKFLSWSCPLQVLKISFQWLQSVFFFRSSSIPLTFLGGQAPRCSDAPRNNYAWNCSSPLPQHLTGVGLCKSGVVSSKENTLYSDFFFLLVWISALSEEPRTSPDWSPFPSLSCFPPSFTRFSLEHLKKITYIGIFVSNSPPWQPLDTTHAVKILWSNTSLKRNILSISHNQTTLRYIFL